MKLIIIASLIACSFAAKLDRTYLPPPGAQSSGGSPGSLETPFGSAGSSGFGQTPSFGVNQGLQGQTQGGNQPAFGTNQGFKAQGGNQFGAAGQGFEQSASDTPEGFDQNSGPQDNFSPEQGFGAESQRPERPQAESDRTAEILRDTNENDGETFSYSFETSNGISAEESGVATNGVQAQGAFAYTGDDGQMYSVTYTADENGYLPRGDHLPTPPPIPDEILRSLEKNAQAAIAGTQEGAYNPEEDVTTPQQYNAQNSPQQSAGQFQQYGVPASPFDAPVSNQEAQMNYNAGTNGAAAAKFAPKGDAPARFSPSAPTASSGFVPSAPTGPDSTRFAPSRPAQSGFAPSAPSTFTPSRPSQGPVNFASASAAQQYNRPTPNFRQQNNIPVQAQDESGYQYNQPQNGGSQVFRAATSSFGASPSSNAGSQGSFARPTSGRPETPAFIAQPARPAAPISNNGFQAQRPSVPISNNAQSVRYNAGGNFQRPSAPVSNNAQYNGVGNGFQASRPTPVSKNVQPTQYNAGSTVQRPSNNVQPSQYNAASNYQSSRIPEYQSAPYQYNPPRPQGQQRPQQNGNQGSGPFNPLATQTFNQGGQIQGPQNQGSQKQVRPSGQDFSGPLQQPSFSPEEGYKY